jgi:hypothetical protein
VLESEASQVEVDKAVELARLKRQLAEQAEELAIKKGNLLRKEPEVKYAFMQENTGFFDW